MVAKYADPLYALWYTMISRCHNVNDHAYHGYGAKGIKVCDRWRKSFKHFKEDMGTRPKNFSIERRNNKQGYKPSNCYWASAKEQARNRSTNNYITVGRDTKTITDWAELGKVGQKTIRKRLKQGWVAKDAIFQPANVVYYKDKFYDLSKLSAKYEISKDLIRLRLRRGWSLKSALKTTTRNNIITYAGRSMNLASWVRELNVSRHTITKCLEETGSLEKLVIRTPK